MKKAAFTAAAAQSFAVCAARALAQSSTAARGAGGLEEVLIVGQRLDRTEPARLRRALS